MPQSAEAPAAHEGLDSGRLRAILNGCRLDLGNLRRDVASNGGGRRGVAVRAGKAGPERRLCQVVERLERTAGTLDAVLDRVAGQPSAATAAEVLAREADHRIKNSLQTVIALLEQQARRAEAQAVREALHLASGRVEAVAQVHATLHAAPSAYGILPELGLDSYLGNLCAALGRAMGADGERRPVRVELAVEPLAVSPAAAQQLGLVVAELVTNALRHAFRPDQPGAVWVTGARQRDGSYTLCVADDGRGLPSGFDIRLRSSGLGLRLVNVLADQLQARLTVDGHVGARFTLALPPSMTAGGGTVSRQPK